VTVHDLRVGSGFDVHAFSADPARALVLGGVVISGARGLLGHSDADVIAHACTEALLGAAGLGDLGSWFPDSDPAYAGADSIELLRTVAEELGRSGWSAVNVDCSVVCEQPKLAPHRAAMQRRLTDAVGAPVTVKGRRAEGMGALGRREGIACWAVALVARVGNA
jgi:2-C-methyl-D-erythritol 2,4-cyclodiphosphate synthase